MTVATCCPFLLTTNPVTPSLSLILSGAGSFQVRVMEVSLWSAMRRSCGGPLGTEVEWRKEWGVGAVMEQFLFSNRAKDSGEATKWV